MDNRIKRFLVGLYLTIQTMEVPYVELLVLIITVKRAMFLNMMTLKIQMIMMRDPYFEFETSEIDSDKANITKRKYKC